MEPLKLPLLRVVLQMCVPLILQNKLPLAESFVSGHRRLEEELVVMLDSWCQAGFTADHISRYPGCVGVFECSCVCCRLELCAHTFTPSCSAADASQTPVPPNTAWTSCSPRFSPSTCSAWWTSSASTQVCLSVCVS